MATKKKAPTKKTVVTKVVKKASAKRAAPRRRYVAELGQPISGNTKLRGNEEDLAQYLKAVSRDDLISMVLANLSAAAISAANYSAAIQSQPFHKLEFATEMPAPDSPAASALDTRLDRARSANVVMYELIETLEKRLSPILSSPGPAEKSDDVSEYHPSRVCAEVAGITDHAMSNAARLQELLFRITV